MENVKKKKVLTKISIGLFFLFAGMEYAVILPTMWLYASERFQAESWFYGIIFAAFSFSSLIMSPLFGMWVDYTRNTKACILFANLFEMGGNFLYFIAWSKYWILGGRLVAGIGAGVSSAIFAQIARTTTEEERTSVYSIAMGLRQFGLLIGPGMNVFLKECNFKLGPFKVDHYTSPGLFMAAIWLLQEILMIFMYYDLPSVNQNDKEPVFTEKPQITNGLHANKEGITNGGLSHLPDNIGSINTAAKDNLCEISSLNNSDSATVHKRRSSSVSSHIVDTWRLSKELMREEIIIILASQFIMFFNETAFEALFTPLSNHLLGWKELENSVAYCLIALEAILTFVLVSKVSKRLSDRWLMVIGVIFEGLALVWYLIMLADSKPYEAKILPTVIVGTLIIVFGLPFFSVANISLLSKLTDDKVQGVVQGFQRSSTGVAMILGPMWGGSLVDRLFLLLAVMFGLEVFLAILMALSFGRLKAPSSSKLDMPSQYAEISTDENKPLLS
ncbi:predicted protein [Nematostella vectensis]|uniref:Major facilitator superfamily (MFS) profile domain-containing protein n=1 Tax=Nematostella vectensis TaxID=45351 RepID=A7RFQ2_NEMVE|nr:major facilitator superfamily domain-containing protein 8 [Nematostella vectensis]EDO49760.1 predicted protein [Nematostella vectensis]|eukprot:XP_001641823.1 predicted protein [Nematostella vectensis]